MYYGDNINKTKDNIPSVDRIIPSNGYVNGNIIIVSNRANRIKNDATLDELKKVYEYYREYLDK